MARQPPEVRLACRASSVDAARSRPRARHAASPARACRARPHASSSAGAQRRDRLRRRRVAQPVRSGGRARAIIRRWIASARGMSISCSVIDHISVSHGSGLRRTRSHGSRADRAADQRVVAEALVERQQVVVDPDGEAHPRDALARGRLVSGAGGEDDAGRRPPRPARRRRAAAARTRRRGDATARPATADRAGTAPSAVVRPRRTSSATLNRGAAGGRRPGTSSTTRSRRSGLLLRFLSALLGAVARDDGDRRGAGARSRSPRARRPGRRAR